MMKKVDYYKKIQELQEEIDRIKKTKKCFTVGDEIFYAPYVISKEVKFNTYKIIESLVDENGIDFFISDDVKEGIVNEEQIFKYRNEAIKKYNENLLNTLSTLVKEKLLSEKDRIEFRTSNKPVDKIYLDDDVKMMIIMEIIEHGNSDETIDIIYNDLSK